MLQDQLGKEANRCLIQEAKCHFNWTLSCVAAKLLETNHLTKVNQTVSKTICLILWTWQRFIFDDFLQLIMIYSFHDVISSKHWYLFFILVILSIKQYKKPGILSIRQAWWRNILFCGIVIVTIILLFVHTELVPKIMENITLDKKHRANNFSLHLIKQ